MKTDNELIAEFMGFTTASPNTYDVPEECRRFVFGGCYTTYKDVLRFHDSWDWLMPVVEKIETIVLPKGTFEDWPYPENVSISIRIDSCWINVGDNMWSKQVKGREFLDHHNHKKGTKIQSTYAAVVEFIKWYNQNKVSHE